MRVCICICICIYLQRERERERDVCVYNTGLQSGSLRRVPRQHAERRTDTAEFISRYIYIYIYVYIYIYTEREGERDTSMCIYIYIYTHTCNLSLKPIVETPTEWYVTYASKSCISVLWGTLTVRGRIARGGSLRRSPLNMT